MRKVLFAARQQSRCSSAAPSHSRKRRRSTSRRPGSAIATSRCKAATPSAGRTPTRPSHEVAVDKTNCKLSLMPSQSGSCTFATPGTFTFNDPTMKGSDQKGSPFAGTLSVAQNTRAVSIAASKSLMIFGDAITLSGTIASKQAGESVTITSQPKGEPTWSTQVTTTDRRRLEPPGAAADPHDVPGEARHRRQRTDHGERPAADHAAEGRPQQLPRGRPRAALDGGQDRGRRTVDGLRLDDDRPGAAPEHRAHEHGRGRPRHVVRRTSGRSCASS